MHILCFLQGPYSLYLLQDSSLLLYIWYLCLCLPAGYLHNFISSCRVLHCHSAGRHGVLDAVQQSVHVACAFFFFHCCVLQFVHVAFLVFSVLCPALFLFFFFVFLFSSLFLALVSALCLCFCLCFSVFLFFYLANSRFMQIWHLPSFFSCFICSASLYFIAFFK